MRVADFKINDALQAFRRDHVDLGAQTLRRAEAVAAVVLVERIVRILKTEVPHALSLDVGCIGGGECGADKPGRKQKRVFTINKNGFSYPASRKELWGEHL